MVGHPMCTPRALARTCGEGGRRSEQLMVPYSAYPCYVSVRRGARGSEMGFFRNVLAKVAGRDATSEILGSVQPKYHSRFGGMWIDREDWLKWLPCTGPRAG